MQTADLVFVAVLALVLWVAWQRRGQVDPARAKELVDEGATLLDVRSRGEFASGHLPDAVNVPVGELDAALERLAAEGRPVVVYCASGMRSARAASQLKASGIDDVHDLGGMGRWPG